MVDNPQKFSDTMPLCTAVGFALRDLLVIIIHKDGIVLDDRQDYLVKGLSEIF